MLARIGWFVAVSLVVGCAESKPPKPSSPPEPLAGTKAEKFATVDPATDAADPAKEAVDPPEDAPPVIDPVATALRGKPVGLSAVKSVRFNPEGSRLAVGSGDGVVRVWDVAQRTILHTIAAHDNWAFDLNFSPDGKILVSGGGDDLIKLWDAETGKQRTETARQEDDIHGVAFSPDGQSIISGSDDTLVMIWKPTSDKRRLLEGHEKQITAIAMRPDGRQFASASRDGTIRLWSLPEGNEAETLAEHDADVLAITYSPDGKTLASASYDNTVRLWDVEKGSSLRVLNGHKDWVFCVAITPDSSYLFSGAGDEVGILWNLKTGEIADEFQFDSDVTAADFSPDGKLLAIGFMSGEVWLAQYADGQLKYQDMLAPAGKQVEVSRADQIQPSEYLELHNNAARQGNPEWSDAVARLATVGDGFTLTILEEIDESKLTAAETELFNRSRQQIQDRANGRKKPWTAAHIDRLLEKAAYSDLMCDPTESTLVPWTLKSLRGAAESTSIVREMIVRVENDYKLSPSFEKDLKSKTRDLYGEAGDAELEKSLLDSAQERVRNYARRILNPTPRSDSPN
ncbi:WD domain, G-beta repeat [Symmachiella macrocystis]|uniref:WD domain, G-beta repeat n=1 Tax=Symmachiella macrocystis TaxID=2527985 RepID=A0A5C6BJM4_9PLAN|nr:WD40 repeat domain-containing protein [Symmachiella macrocystis]TWU11771.1 WD domain, G-beta repeat [Symmachiella macrocystis]